MHAYPPDLASFVAQHWETAAPRSAQTAGARSAPSESLPPPEAVERLISTCYQASLLRDEERLVTFRAICYPPELLPADNGPPTGLHRLAFTHPRPFTE